MAFDIDTSPVKLIDLYKTIIDTRKLEINLFWQRSNYFLILNSAIGLGYFKITDQKYAWVFAIMGLLAAILWFRVCLGGKFWQTRWEQRLMDFERTYMSELDFFGADINRIREDVKKGYNFDSNSPIKRFIYNMSLNKPSVSFSMILLSLIFIAGWALFILILLFK